MSTVYKYRDAGGFIASMVGFRKALKEIDKDLTRYFQGVTKLPSRDEAASRVATWLYDCDFDVDETSWELLQKVRTVLPDIWLLTLEKLFKRQHDT